MGGAFGTGLAAGLGSFAGGLVAGQSPGQAALGGLLSGATAGFFSGAPAGIDPIGPGGSALASTPAELAAEGVSAGVNPGVLGTAGSTTAAQAGGTAAAAALPETVVAGPGSIVDIPDIGLIPSGAGASTPSLAANQASIAAQRAAATNMLASSQGIPLEDAAKLTLTDAFPSVNIDPVEGRNLVTSDLMTFNQPTPDAISSGSFATRAAQDFPDGLQSATNFDDVLPSTTNVERFARIDPKTYEAPNKFQQALGRKRFYW